MLGGSSYRTPANAPGGSKEMPGAFALRDARGVERPLAGRTSATALVVAERGVNAAWAVTSGDTAAGPAYTLQRYVG